MGYKVTKVAEREWSEFQTFEDLEVYQAARTFRKAMYDVTRRLPDFEKYELAGQIRRAAVSLTNNIAEGHGRFHYPDQIRFILHSRGSLEELVDDLNVCLDENYVSPDPSDEAEGKSLGGFGATQRILTLSPKALFLGSGTRQPLLSQRGFA